MYKLFKKEWNPYIKTCTIFLSPTPLNLRGNQNRDGNRPKKVNTVDILFFAGFHWLFCQYICNKCAFIAWNLSSSGCSPVGSFFTTTKSGRGWMLHSAGQIHRLHACKYCRNAKLPHDFMSKSKLRVSFPTFLSQTIPWNIGKNAVLGAAPEFFWSSFASLPPVQK